MPFAYILRCADDTLYVGSTTDLARRLHEHNHAKNGAHYTKIRRPVALIYSEMFDTLAQARSREAKLKQLTRAQKLELVEKPITNPKHHPVRDKTCADEEDALSHFD